MVDTKAPIIGYFRDHPNRDVEIKTLMDHTGNPSRASVQACLGGLVQDGLPGLTVIAKGNRWRFVPPESDDTMEVRFGQDKPTGRLYEEIKRTSNGAILLVDQDGDIYVAPYLKKVIT